MNLTTRQPRLDRAETATTAFAILISSGLYLRYRDPYLARGVVRDVVGLAIGSVPLAARCRRMRHEALVCLAGIGSVHAVGPRWPLDVDDVVWWSTITVALAGYLGLRRRHLK